MTVGCDVRAGAQCSGASRVAEMWGVAEAIGREYTGAECSLDYEVSWMPTGWGWKSLWPQRAAQF